MEKDARVPERFNDVGTASDYLASLLVRTSADGGPFLSRFQYVNVDIFSCFRQKRGSSVYSGVENTTLMKSQWDCFCFVVTVTVNVTVITNCSCSPLTPLLQRAKRC